MFFFTAATVFDCYILTRKHAKAVEIKRCVYLCAWDMGGLLMASLKHWLLSKIPMYAERPNNLNLEQIFAFCLKFSRGELRFNGKSFFKFRKTRLVYVLKLCSRVSFEKSCRFQVLFPFITKRAKNNKALKRFSCRYFLGSTNYFFYGEITAEYFAEFLQREVSFAFAL